MTTTLTIHCSGTSLSGERCGSFHLLHGPREVSREDNFELGDGSQTEAEWLACLAGLDRLLVECVARKRSFKDIRVEIITDSTAVATRLLKCPGARPEPGRAARLWVLAQHAFRRLDRFAGHTARWRGRDGNVQDFGH